MEINSKDLTGIIAVVLIFGGGILYAIIHTVAANWRTIRVTEQNAILKQSMVEKGFTAEEIVSVMRSGAGSEDKIEETAKSH